MASNNLAASVFHTRGKSNEGVDLPLFTPTGEATDYKIRVRGIDSDAYRKMESTLRREAFHFAQTNKGKGDSDGLIDEFLGGQQSRLLAALVISWNLEDEVGKPIPCTPENIVSFLENAPQIAEKINQFATNRSLFFVMSLKPSTPSPELPSSFHSVPEGQPSPSVVT